MSALAIPEYSSVKYTTSKKKSMRVGSIDLLRGIVMIVMALDHVRDYFHHDAFLYDPTDLTKTNVALFFTRFITHYCAPVFVFLAGISAYLSGTKKSTKELASYLFTRGLWLIFIELTIIILARTFNPTFPYVNLQVIWAIGVSMIVLSALVYMPQWFIAAVGIILVAGHNLLDTVHVTGTGSSSFLWSLLHEPKIFVFGHYTIFVQYPLLPWIGIMALGYCFGTLYNSGYDPEKRKKILLWSGLAVITAFLILRSVNIYGDAAHWSIQKNGIFSLLSFLNVTKYPPSLLYTLVTLGPAMVFLALSEKPLDTLAQKISVFGRVPFFYYVAHLYLIHLLALIAAVFSGFPWSSMILADKVNRVPELKTYGFNLLVTYLVWIGLIFLLYPCCNWFDRYKRTHQAQKRWLTYL